MTAALQMAITGVVMTGLGLSLGEAAQWHWTTSSTAALLYLAVFGSCVGYGAYFWLVHQVTPSQLGTYAYVNPAVAVVLGRSEEHTSELPSLMRISYAVFCLKKKTI